MNMIEAIKAGKRIKRKNVSYWISVPEFPDTSFWVNRADIVADDWEVEEEKVLVSKKDVLAFYVQGANDSVASTDLLKPSVISEMLRELGFKE